MKNIKIKKQYFLLLLLITVTIFEKIVAQNIAVNQTGNLPDTSAMLDVSSTNKGFLVPRMTTTQQNAIPLPAKGLLIYNLTDDVFKVNIGTTLSPLWTTLATGSTSISNLLGSTGNTLSSTVNGSAATASIITANTLTLSGANISSTINGISSNQIDISSAINANTWSLTGNSSTTATSNFIGTADAVDFVAKTNNTERLRVTSGGNIGINNAVPIAKLDVRTSSSDITNGITNAVTVNSTASSVVGIDNSIGFNNGSTVSSSVAATAVRATVNGTTGQSYGSLTGLYARIAMNGATSAASAYGINIGTPGGGTVITSLIGINVRDQLGGASNYNLSIGPSGVPSDAGNFSIYNSSGKTNYFAGNLGIGTTGPGSALDVKGTLRLSGATSGYVGFTPASAAGTTTYTLPNADGSNGQQLTTNGSGTLTWSAAGSSSGTVTSASVVSANGFSGTVATATTTPAITLSTTITGLLKGNGTAISAATAGTDFLTPTGSAASLTNFPTFNQNTTGSAATLTTGRTIGITGDLTYTSPAFNGSANLTAAGTLATVNSNIGSFTNANITVNAKGLVTAVSSGTATTVGLLVDADRTTTYTPGSSYSTLIYNVAGTNVGSAYSTTTGVFTAPATGLYQIMISNLYSVANSVNNTLSARIIVNSSTETEVWTSLTPYSGSPIYGTLHGITVVAMTSGQTASIQIGGLSNTMTPSVSAGQHTLKIFRLN